MRNSALYFPYMNVPSSAWFSRVLLYWDTVGSIVPTDYITGPGKHGAYTHELVAAGLVTPLVPGPYIHDIPDFGAPFLAYVEDRVAANRSLRRVIRAEPVKVHAEKTGDIAPELVRLGLAREGDYPWYEMQRWVADAFMTYLATALGALDDVNAAPVTQDRACFELLSGRLPADGAMYRGARELAPARQHRRAVLLKEVFPHPRSPANVRDLVAFKAQHGDKLRRLRNTIELKCLEIEREPDPQVRYEHASLVRTQLRDQIAEASDAVRVTWGQVVVGSICSVLGAAAGAATAPPNHRGAAAAALAGLAGAAYTALEPLRRKNQALKGPLAYAALVNLRYGGG